MSRKSGVRIIHENQESSTKRAERKPLLDSGVDESLTINKGTTDGIGGQVTGVSWGVAAFLLVNTALGAGMLNYPYAYNQIGGILAATLIQIVSKQVNRGEQRLRNLPLEKPFPFDLIVNSQHETIPE